MLNTQRFHSTGPGAISQGICRCAEQSQRPVLSFWVVAGIALIPVVFAVFTAFYVNFNRTNLPDLDGFIRFEPPAMGHIYDAKGHVLIELGRERRDIIRYEEIPDVVREAILSAEDKNFFSHSGVDYSVFLRLLAKTNIRALVAHFTTFDGEDASKRPPVFPQGGSTITQQLVRGYFLQKLSSTKNSNSLQHEGILPHVLAFVIGVPGTNKLLLKIEAIRLSLWIEEEMRKQYGSKRRAKEELFARYANFVYLGNGRYGFAAASDYYFHKPIETFTVDDADKAAAAGWYHKVAWRIRSHCGKHSKTHAPEKSDIEPHGGEPLSTRGGGPAPRASAHSFGCACHATGRSARRGGNDSRGTQTTRFQPRLRARN